MPDSRVATGLDFNHAMLYVRHLDAALGFFVDGLGFRVVENLAGYARLRAPRGTGTLALHHAAPGQDVSSRGVRLYFEVPRIEEFCAELERKGIRFESPLARKPWGWTHAYLTDPDGHELSLYWAGAARFKKTPSAK
jgi:catechol 2,3-dioxygenase-like lactoylglutathione lyase family enzyme